MLLSFTLNLRGPLQQVPVVRLGGETSLGAPGAADPFPSPHPTPAAERTGFPAPGPLCSVAPA